jgi:hypothetical protein
MKNKYVWLKTDSQIPHFKYLVDFVRFSILGKNLHWACCTASPKQLTACRSFKTLQIMFQILNPAALRRP